MKLPELADREEEKSITRWIIARESLGLFSESEMWSGFVGRSRGCWQSL